MHRPAAALIAAFQTLTRLPVPSAPSAPDARTMALSAVYYPWIGLLLGGLGWLLYSAVWPYLGANFAALSVLALWALLTGALHEDGLADVADAFGSQQTREGLLRVMRDSRIGAYGALALLLATLARWTLLSELPAPAMLFACLASQSLGRAGIVLLAVWAGPAAQGSGSSLASGLRAPHVIAACAAPPAVLLALGPPLWALQCAASSLLAVGLATCYFRARLGGVTGDCLGAAFLAQEIAVLVTIRVALP